MAEVVIAVTSRCPRIFISIDEERRVIRFSSENNYVAVELDTRNMQILKDFLIEEGKVDFSEGEV